jgi:hypothetical protein
MVVVTAAADVVNGDRRSAHRILCATVGTSCSELSGRAGATARAFFVPFEAGLPTTFNAGSHANRDMPSFALLARTRGPEARRPEESPSARRAYAKVREGKEIP